MQDAHLAETQQSLIPIRPQYQQRQRQNQQFEGGENFDDYVDRKTGWQPTSSENWWLFRFPGKNSRNSTGVCRQYTHKHCTYSKVQFVHKRGTQTTRLAQAITDCIFIFVRLKRICHLVLHMSHLLLFSQLPFTASTSSHSFTLPSTTTQEYEGHPVHHAHLQALPVDKLRH